MTVFKKSVAGIFGMLLIFHFSQLTVNAKETTTYLATEDGTTIGIESPNIITSTTIWKYKSANATPYYQISKENGIVTISFSITPSPYGTTIEIPFDFSNDESIVLVQGKEYNTSAGNIFNKENKSIGVISTKLVTGQANVTSKIYKNKSIVLNVDSNTEPVTLQADIMASDYSTYFSDYSWITRGGHNSLSLTQKAYMTESDEYLLSIAKRKDAWDKVVRLHGKDVNWSNESGLKNQFDCHYYFAKQKSIWNLETTRADVGYFSTILAGCNP